MFSKDLFTNIVFDVYQDMMAEARLLRQHKGRLEARMQILEEHNRQLEAQLQRLRRLLDEVRYVSPDKVDLNFITQHLAMLYMNIV